MRALQLWIATAILMVAGGCGGGTTAPTILATITSGNWAMLLISQANPPVFVVLGGSLTQQGNSISGILHISDSPCFDALLDDLVVSGTVAGEMLTLSTVPVRGQTITISATLPIAGGASLLNGNYTSAGSTCIAASGTFGAFLVQLLTGTFSGPITGSLTAGVTATLTQTGPDAHGFFHLSGNFAFSGSPCFTSGAIAGSSLSGIKADLVVSTNDGGQTTVSGLNTMIGLVDNLGADLTVQSGTCAGLAGSGTLMKQ
ncbi:MAG TPA: hypothetical protein VI636_18600 [Candidatus Angelobacter sp.]